MHLQYVWQYSHFTSTYFGTTMLSLGTDTNLKIIYNTINYIYLSI